MAYTTVKVKVSNRIAQLVSDYDYGKLISYWSHAVNSYIYMSKPWYRKCKICRLYASECRKKYGKDHEYEPIWDGRIKYLKNDTLPAGLFWATYKDIEKKEKIKFKIGTRVQCPEEQALNEHIESEGKYEFQNECADKVVNKIVHGRGGLVLNATGSGKTRIAAMIASRLDCEVLMIVDQLDLLDQARKDIKLHLKEKVGKVGESKFKLKRVTVATIQTLHLHRNDRRFRKWFERVEVIIIDEIHSMLNKSNFDVIKIAKPLATIGLTATLGISQKPVRLKAYSLCGPIIYSYPITKGIEDKVLSKGICISLQYDNHIDNIEGYKAHEAYDEKIVNNSERNWIIAKIVKTARKKGKYTLVLVERIKHLEKLSKRLDNIPHRVISGTFKGKHTSVLTRLKYKDKFEAGKVRVILANKVFKKGIDIKRLDCVINAAGRKSKNDAVQIFGRGIRRHAKKLGLVYIDITDYDSYDNSSSKNWFHKAGKSRIKALKKIGIVVDKIVYEDEEDIDKIFTRSDKLLRK